MKQKIFIFPVIIFIICTFLPSQSIFSEQEGDDILIFRWAFLFRNKTENPEVLDHTKPSTPVKTGDTFKIFLQPVKNAHMYLFLLDAEEEFSLLFPPGFDIKLEEEEHYYLPDDTNWYFIKEGEGTEKFYLIVSHTRLTEIEQLFNEYTLLREKPGSREAVYTAKQKVIDKIEYLFKEETVFSGIVERPYTVAGEWRTLLGDREFNAIDVKTERFYAKKIRFVR